MVIAIEQHQIAWREEGIEHHFVGRGGAVQHEVGFIRIKDFCRMLLGDAWRAFMDQQIAHCHVGIAQIGAEKRFAKEIDKLVSGRMDKRIWNGENGLFDAGAWKAELCQSILPTAAAPADVVFDRHGGDAMRQKKQRFGLTGGLETVKALFPSETELEVLEWFGL